MAFALWCKLSNISRQHYQGLLEVLEMLEEGNVRLIRQLLRSITTNEFRWKGQ